MIVIDIDARINRGYDGVVSPIGLKIRFSCSVLGSIFIIQGHLKKQPTSRKNNHDEHKSRPDFCWAKPNESLKSDVSGINHAYPEYFSVKNATPTSRTQFSSVQYGRPQQTHGVD
jgi:hypothetical protein